MLRRLFLDHPASVDESYSEHLGVALGFGATMVAGGAACMVHAVLPFVFQTTGSDTVTALHRQMLAKRAAKRAANLQMTTVEYVI